MNDPHIVRKLATKAAQKFLQKGKLEQAAEILREFLPATLAEAEQERERKEAVEKHVIDIALDIALVDRTRFYIKYAASHSVRFSAMLTLIATHTHGRW